MPENGGGGTCPMGKGGRGHLSHGKGGRGHLSHGNRGRGHLYPGTGSGGTCTWKRVQGTPVTGNGDFSHWYGWRGTTSVRPKGLSLLRWTPYHLGPEAVDG